MLSFVTEIPTTNPYCMKLKDLKIEVVWCDQHRQNSQGN
jgi:hypothetical protein